MTIGAEDVVLFFAEFYKKYPNLMTNDLHLAGESYGGKYMPIFAMYLYNAGVPFKSVVIIDPYTVPVL